MRLCVFTLTGACLFLFLCPPAHGQTSCKAPSGDPQKAAEDKDPIAIVELGAATSWNLRGAATFAPNHFYWLNPGRQIATPPATSIRCALTQ
jgi:hypothetical protein